VATTGRNVVFGRPAGYWGTGFGHLIPAGRHKLDFRDQPGGLIDFQLSKGVIKRGYHFDTSEPIWVGQDTGACPPTTHCHPDIEIVSVTIDCLTVNNAKSSGHVRLRYQLNVLDRSGNRVPIDPIIEN